jgi:murein DD-endopeptidase MepM/ murein hydrolase activator NlpD
MSESLPFVFAIYPLLLSGIALGWLYYVRDRAHPGRTVWFLACGGIIVFVFLTGPWAFTSYYLRYVLLVLFAYMAASSCRRTQHGSPRTPAADGRITVPAVLLVMLFTVLDVLAIASRYPAGKTLDLHPPFGSGRHYVLQGGSSAITNPFHSLYGNELALDIVRLNRPGNRADGIAPRALEGYRSFGETLLSPCRGSIASVRDGLPNNAPGHPDTGHPAGNHIVLNCAGGGDVLMAHLKRGSIQVAPGDVVATGQRLAEIGNSGNTLEPHLHIEATIRGEKTGLTIDGRALSINSLLTNAVTGPADPAPD